MLTPRERVLCALNHEQPDRVPIFFGTSSPTSMLAPAYEKLKAYLGIRREPRLLSKTFQYAQLDEEALVRCGSDGRLISPRPIPSGRPQEGRPQGGRPQEGRPQEGRPQGIAPTAARRGRPQGGRPQGIAPTAGRREGPQGGRPQGIAPTAGRRGRPQGIAPTVARRGRPQGIAPTAEDRLIDDWGVTWERRPGSLYYEVVDVPLRHATIDDLGTYAWPELAHPDRFEGLAEEARALREGTPYAIVALGYLSTFEHIQLLRGLDAWLADLAANPEFAHAILRRLTDVMIAGVARYLEAVGPYIDLITFSDDLGTQRAPLISPRMYRRMIKPYQAEVIAAVKARSKAKVFFHSCGNIYPLIGDLIEIGVDVLNPVQVSAGEMGDTARLKREFGGRLTFCGAIDTQRVLPYGTTDDVRTEVRRRIRDLAPGGGYILAAVHAIQPDVPPENVLAMFDEAMVAGRYPLKV